MADDRKIILQLEIDATTGIKNIIDVKDRITVLKKEQAALNTTTVEGKKTYEAYNAQIKALTKEQRSLELAVEKTAAGFEFQSGSIASNRAELSRLTSEYKNLAKPTAEQTKRIKELSDKLKEQESAIGNTTRNVGNYKEAITQSLNGMNLLGGQLGGTLGKFNALRTGLTQGATGFKVLGGAIAATGILAFVLIIQKLIDYFKATEAGAELIERALAGVGAVIDTLIVNIDRVGKIALDAFNLLFQIATLNFDGAIKSVDSIANSSSELSKDLKSAANEAIELKGRLQDLEDLELKQSVLNAKRRNDVALLIKQSKDRTLAESERLALLDRASEIERTGSKEEIANAKERLAIANKQLEIDIRNGKIDKGNISKQAADAEIAYQNALGQSQEKLAALDARRSAFLLAEQAERQKAIDKQIELNKQLEDAIIDNIASLRDREIAESQKTFERKIASVKGNSKTEIALRVQLETQGRNQLIAINKKFDDQELKDQEKHNQDLINSANALTNQRAQNSVKNIGFEIQQEQNNAQELLAIDGLTAKQREDIRFESDTRIISLIRQRAKEEIAIEESIANEKLKNQNLTEFDRIAIQEGLDQRRLESERSVNAQIVDINKQATKAVLDDAKNAETERTKLYAKRVSDVNAAATAAIQINQIAGDIEQANIERRRKEELASSAKDKATQDKINKKYDKIAEDQQKKSAKADILIKEIQVAVNAALAISEALASGPPPANFVLAGIVGIAAGAQIAALETQKSQLADGGLLQGPLHSQGGITGTGRFANIEVEGGEMVMSRKATRDNYALLNNLNYQAKRSSSAPMTNRGSYKRHYAGGGILSDGGLSARDASGNIENSNRQINSLSQSIENIQVVTLVKDIKSGLQRSNEVVERARVTK